jgi:nucleoside-diphosphate-sugar epimerase
MKVLFIGGTGNLSSACTEIAINKGIEIYHLNRGLTQKTQSTKEVKTIVADIHDTKKVAESLREMTFDSVVDFIAYEPTDILNDIQLFKNKTHQYVFISTASAYQKPPEKLPITEETPLYNPYWEYSRKKIACEKLLEEEYQKSGFPYTIIRPSHTYGKTTVPLIGGYTILHRMLKGEPVIVHGDGTSIWTLTYNKDFAVGVIGLLGNKDAIHKAFHITSDEWLSWNTIYEIMANELGVRPQLVHVPSEIIAKYNQEMGDGLLGDKSHSMIFDNSKIKKFVPEFHPQVSFCEGAKEIISWYKENTIQQSVNLEINETMNNIIHDLKRCQWFPLSKE